MEENNVERVPEQNNTVSGQNNVGAVPVQRPVENVPEQNSGERKPIEGMKGILVGICVLFIIMAFVTVGFLIYRKNYMSKSENVYEVTINQLMKTYKQTMENYENRTKALEEIELKLDTNIEDLKPFADYSYRLKAGLDLDNKNLEFGFSEVGTNEVGLNVYIKDGKEYLKLSTYNSLIQIAGAEEESFDEIFGFIETSFQTNVKDMDYMVEKYAKWVSDGIDSEKIEKSDADIMIAGKTVSATQHQYLLNNEAIEEIERSILDGMLNDEKALGIYADTTGLSKAEVKQALEDARKELKVEIFDNETDGWVMNIYTASDDVVGVQFTTTSGKEQAYYYFNENGFSFGLLNLISTNDYMMTDLTMEGVKSGSATNVSVELAGVEIATMKVREFSSEKIDLDYTLASEFPISGTFKMSNTQTSDQMKTNVQLSYEINGQYIALSLDGTTNWNAKVADIDPTTAVELTEEGMEELITDFMEKVMETPLGMGFYMMPTEVEYVG